MAAEDYFYDDRPVTTECQRCGKGGLHWDKDDEGRWALLETTYRIHRCNEKRLHAVITGDFEAVE